jgi:dolichyl-phosphate-mannose--protein O-mannosyl transferase
VIDLTKPPPPSSEPDARPAATPVSDVIRRRLTTVAADPLSWLATFLVVFVGAAIRLIGLRQPPDKIFDEIYYATEAHELLQYKVEWRPETNTGDFVVHPPLGKWLIGLGELATNYDSFGWRISAAVAGSLSILLLVRIARRLFRSTMLGCAAGLLLAFDGLHFVLSRAALLDIFLTLFVLAAFGCLLLDRDKHRVKWMAALDSGTRPRYIRWWRIAAALCIGCACAVKLSAAFFIPALMLLMLMWEIGIRRTVGQPRPWVSALLNVMAWGAGMGLLIFAVYLASWAGWFATDYGWNRHGLAAQGKPEPPVIGALINLWNYHSQAYAFHRGLKSHHDYQSWPWQWLLMGRPVAFYWNTSQPCGDPRCASEVLLLGTPLLWWSFIPALAGMAWFGIAQRDRRAVAIAAMVVAGLLPWFWYEYDGGRTMFVFYALPAAPFLVLAVVYVLGAIMGPPGQRMAAAATSRVAMLTNRRAVGAIVLGVYVLVIAACFAYFYPIYTGESIPYQAWWDRMWLGRRWV